MGGPGHFIFSNWRENTSGLELRFSRYSKIGILFIRKNYIFLLQFNFSILTGEYVVIKF